MRAEICVEGSHFGIGFPKWSASWLKGEEWLAGAYFTDQSQARWAMLSVNDEVLLLIDAEALAFTNSAGSSMESFSSVNPRSERLISVMTGDFLSASVESMTDPEKDALIRNEDGSLSEPSKTVWLSWISMCGSARFVVDAKGSSGRMTFSASVRSENDWPLWVLDKVAFAEM